ncbi:TPA: hypothetical protein ROY17_005586 [Bacillus thuringiensis]|nr:hypothetical protein [Bacillus thuringiensis]
MKYRDRIQAKLRVKKALLVTATTMALGLGTVEGTSIFADTDFTSAEGFVLMSDGKWRDPKKGRTVLNGPQMIDNKWYYLVNGKVAFGWTDINGDGKFIRYYNEDGSAFQETGLQEIQGALYYFTSKGNVLNKKGAQTIEGNEYYVNADYSLFTGLFKMDDGKWSYFNPETAIKVKNKTVIIEGDTYTFDSNGVCVESS